MKTLEISENGNISYFKNNKLHRDNDLPSIISNNGDMRWYKDNKIHRENKPAFSSSCGTILLWYRNGGYCNDNNNPNINGGYITWHKTNRNCFPDSINVFTGEEWKS